MGPSEFPEWDSLEHLNLITSEEFMEDHEKLWKKARKNNSLLPVGSR